MKRIVLIRHGESQWNMENRFTGWTNVDLTEKGKKEAYDAGVLLKKNGFHFDIAYTSYLKRAVKTLNNVLDAMDEDWIPVEKTWRLNEKHYGMLQGLNKAETAEKYGDEQVHVWRRSYDVAPHDLPADGIGSAFSDPRYALVPEEYLPKTESLKDALLGVRHLPKAQGSRQYRCSRSRKQPPRYRQAPEEHQQRGYLLSEHSYRHSLCLRVR